MPDISSATVGFCERLSPSGYHGYGANAEMTNLPRHEAALQAHLIGAIAGLRALGGDPALVVFGQTRAAARRRLHDDRARLLCLDPCRIACQPAEGSSGRQRDQNDPGNSE